MATKTLTVSENVSYICFPPLNAKTVKGKLAFDCPVVYLYFGFTPTFDIEPQKIKKRARKKPTQKMSRFLRCQR